MQPVPKTPAFQISEARGKPVATAYGRITPIARIVQLRWPGGGIIWNRAVAIEVSYQQELRRVPVRDITSRITAAIILSGLIVAASFTLLLRKKRGNS